MEKICLNKDAVRVAIKAEEVIDAKKYHELIDFFGEDKVRQCLNEYIQEELAKGKEDLYQAQLQIWEKIGYYLATLEHNFMEQEIVKHFDSVSENITNKCYSDQNGSKDAKDLLTHQEEVYYGFWLLGRDYCSIFTNEKDDTEIDVRKIFSSISNVGVRDTVLEKFKYLYVKCTNYSNFDKKLQRFLNHYQLETVKESFPDVDKLFPVSKEVSMNPPLKFEDDRELLEQLDMYIRYRIARECFMNSNLKLVGSIAQSIIINLSLQKVERDDAIQDGVFGLVKAIQKYDIRRQCKFSTYAYLWIKQYILRSNQNFSNTVRFPVYLQSAMAKIKKMQLRIYQEQGQTSPLEELESALNMTKGQLNNIQEVFFQLNCDSLNHFIRIGEGEAWEMEETVPDTDSLFEEKVITKQFANEVLEVMNSRLSEKEKIILLERCGYFDGKEKSQEEVGQKLGMTRQAVHFIEKKAKMKVKRVSKLYQTPPFES